MTFFRVKRVKNRGYVYEMESYRDRDGEPRNRMVRYIGPANPAPVRRAVDIGQLRGGNSPAENGRGKSPADRKEEREWKRQDAKIQKQIRDGAW